MTRISALKMVVKTTETIELLIGYRLWLHPIETSDSIFTLTMSPTKPFFPPGTTYTMPSSYILYSSIVYIPHCPSSSKRLRIFLPIGINSHDHPIPKFTTTNSNLLEGTPPWTPLSNFEVEFIVAFKPANFADRSAPELERSVYNHIITILREAGFSVNPSGPTLNYSNWTVEFDMSIKAEPENAHWMDYEFVGVEIKTPIFFFHDRAAAFEQLATAFHLIQLRYKMFTNNTCGLHVHVGNQSLGFPRQTLKKFSQMVLVFEHQLESLHPANRLNNIHCLAPGTNFPTKDPTKNVRLIQQAQSTVAIVHHMSCQPDGHRRGFAYNVSNLQDEQVMPKPTIEFRQHEGTLDMTAIAAWVGLACGLVEVCHWMTRKDIEAFLTEGIRNPSIKIVDLLKELRLGDVAAYYQKRGLHEHPQPLPETPAAETEAEMGDDGLDSDSDLSSVDDLSDMDEDELPVPRPSSHQPRKPRESRKPASDVSTDRIHPEQTSSTPSTSSQPDTSGDAELARRLALNLRPRAARRR